jgi:hypothetical protein
MLNVHHYCIILDTVTRTLVLPPIIIFGLFWHRKIGYKDQHKDLSGVFLVAFLYSWYFSNVFNCINDLTIHNTSIPSSGLKLPDVTRDVKKCEIFLE